MTTQGSQKLTIEKLYWESQGIKYFILTEPNRLRVIAGTSMVKTASPYHTDLFMDQLDSFLANVVDAWQMQPTAKVCSLLDIAADAIGIDRSTAWTAFMYAVRSGWLPIELSSELDLESTL